MLTPRVTVIKMSKMALFILFSADDTISLVTAWEKYLSAPKDLSNFLSENGVVNRILS